MFDELIIDDVQLERLEGAIRVTKTIGTQSVIMALTDEESRQYIQFFLAHALDETTG
jgi:hypothetical protein